MRVDLQSAVSASNLTAITAVRSGYAAECCKRETHMNWVGLKSSKLKSVCYSL
jgi:hypothetical protein